MSSKLLGPGRGCALALAFAIAAEAAWAEETSPAALPGETSSLPGETSSVPPATTSSLRDDELPAIDEIVIVGRRKRAEVERDPTASATVIEADRFAGEAKGVAELVSTAPGVAVNEYGGLGHFTTVSVRGANANGVLVLIDGLPVDSVLGGGVDLAAVPRAWVDRLEVVRGAEGAHYGAGALGGVVNVVTRGAGDRGWSFEAGGGSFETYTLSADASAQVGGGTLLASVTAESTGGAFPYRFDPTLDLPGDATREEIRENNAVRRAGGLLKGAWTLGAARLDAALQGWSGRRELPGAVRDLSLGDWQEDARVLLSARLSAPVGRRLLVAARPSFRFDRVDTRVESSLAEQRGSAAALQLEARLAHGDSQLRATVEGETERLRADGLATPYSRNTFAAALSEDLALARGRVRLGPAVRVERVGDFSGVSAKAGASVRIVGPLAIRGSAGTTFRAPSFSELYLKQGQVQPNPDLRPEEGIGADASLVAEHPLGFASVGAHTTVYRDLIFYEPATHGILKPQNSSEALVRGLEAEAALAPVRALGGLSLSGSYTLLDSRILRGVEGTVGNPLPHRARHRLYARAAIAPGPFEAHVELHAVGRQAADSRALRPIEAARTWNAGVSFQVLRRPSLRVHAEVRNLLDDRTLEDALGNPLPSRTVLFTLRAGPARKEGSPP